MFDFDLTKIKAMVFDVDGVLSCSTIAMDEEGQPLRTLNVKDGYAIQLAVKRGLVVAIISGGRSQNIVRRYEYLGVRHIYMGSSYKLRDLDDLAARTGIALDEMLYMGDDPFAPLMLRPRSRRFPATSAPFREGQEPRATWSNRCSRHREVG